MQLSVCIIAKNEEKNIERCLAALKPTGFELVVVDTGSADRTKEIALRYTDRVYDYAWCDDFAAAKNYAVSKASNDCVMVIDSDEFVEELDKDELSRMLREHPDEVGRIHRRNTFSRKGVGQENREWINRIFDRKRFHYEGRIHEQITPLGGGEYKTYRAPVVIEHTGYDLTEEERRKKADRNIALLKRELEQLGAEEEQEQAPYLLYQLGKSYYMTEDYANACEFFSRGLSYDLNPRLEYVIDMVETYGYALLNGGQAEQALFFENIYQEFGTSADFQFLMGLIYMNNARFQEAITEFLKAVKHSECRNQGTNSYASYYNAGVIYECLGDREKARECYKRCGEYEPAVKRLQEDGGI